MTNTASLTVGSGATLRFEGDVIQQGSVALTAGTIDLGGDFHLTDLGNYTRTGGTVNLSGTLENTGLTLALNNTTGSWNLAGGEIIGGTVSTSGTAALTLHGSPGATFLYPDGTLDGVILQTNLTVEQGATLDIVAGLTLDATLTVQGAGNNAYSTDLDFLGTQTLGGTGQIVLGSKAPAVIDIGSNYDGTKGVLTLGSGINISGQGSIQAYSGSSGGSQLINQGTIAISTAGQMLSILSDLHNTAQIQVPDKTTLTLGGTLTLADLSGVVVSGSGKVILTGTLNNAGGTVDLDQLPSYLQFSGGQILGGTVVTGSGPYTLASGASMVLNGVTLQGQVNVPTGTTLTMSGSWKNTGTLNETGGTLNLGGTFTLAALGTLTRSGGTINLTGTLDNTGTTLALNTTTGSWNLDGGTLKNGTYTASGGASLVFSTTGGTLDGVTASSNLDLSVVSGVTVQIKDGLTLNGSTVLLGNSAGSTYGSLEFSNSGTLGGTGTVLMGGDSANALYSDSGTTLTIGTGITVHGVSGSLGNYYYYYYYTSTTGTIINQGTIQADNSGGSGGTGSGYGITIDSGTFTNQGTVSASNGAVLSIDGTWSNAATGTISANNATLDLGDQYSTSANTWSNAGTITGIGCHDQPRRRVYSIVGGNADAHRRYDQPGRNVEQCRHDTGAERLDGLVESGGRHDRGRQLQCLGRGLAGLHDLGRHAGRRHGEQRPLPESDRRRLRIHLGWPDAERHHHSPGQRFRHDQRLFELRQHRDPGRHRVRSVR